MEKQAKLKIVFVGVPDLALICLSNLLIQKFNIVAVVPPHKSNETYYLFKNFVEEKKLNFLEFESSPNEKSYIEKIRSLNADIGVCCSYNTKLSKEFLSTTRLGYINCHPSLLPQYRGAMPYFHIINNNEKTSGITLHMMDENFDTGDIIYQEEFSLSENETMGILFNRTSYMLSDALIETLKKIETSGQIKKIPQNKEIKAIKAPKVSGSFKVNWCDEVQKIDSLIRASNPFFSVWTTFRATSLKIIKAHIFDNEIDNRIQLGRIYKADKNNLIIQAKNGKLALDVFQVGTWGIFQAEDFYNTFSPREDEFLI